MIHEYTEIQGTRPTVFLLFFHGAIAIKVTILPNFVDASHLKLVETDVLCWLPV